jgi:Pup amidohydrolase
MLDRLVGLETEYALRFQPQDPAGPRIANAELFARLQTYINVKLPTVRAIGSEQCWFVANGGGLKFECFPFYKLLAAAGYVEGATPECRGPGQLLRYQRAQDVLLSQAAAASGRGDGAATLLKELPRRAGSLLRHA